MFEFTVNLDSGESYEVKATSRDIITWEKTSRTGSLMRLQENLHMTDLTAVAYYASVRQGLYTGKLVDFENSVDIDMTEDEETAPFQKAA